jgi:hypothetical protein
MTKKALLLERFVAYVDAHLSLNLELRKRLVNQIDGINVLMFYVL